MRYRIAAPAEGHTGVVAGVPFRGGVAELDTDAPGAGAALAYFRRRGYSIEPAGDASPGGAPLAARPPQAASVADWRAWAVACGATQADADDATKAQLIEQYGKGDA